MPAVSFRKEIVYVAVTVLCLIAILEGISRAVLSSDMFFNRLAGNDQSSWRLSWIKRHPKFDTIQYDFDIHDPVRGWALKPGLNNVLVWGDKVLSSNSKGIRGRTEYLYTKPADKTRILMLGDSFTFGEEVGDRETFPYYLEKILPNSEVINMGVHGYGHDQMLLYLKEEGVKYRPDIVILGFLYYDMERNLLNFRDYGKPKFKLVNGQLRLVHCPVPPPKQMIQSEFFKFKLVDLWTILVNRYADACGVNDHKMKKITKAILREIVRTAEGIHAIPVFVYLPNERDFENFFDAPSQREKFFLDTCREENFHCTSVRPAFLAQLKRGIPLGYYGHWGPKGHWLAARVIRSYLEQKNFVVGAVRKTNASS
ncbi:MAG: SGNH/GDSL hydrolase family protein [Candidatus Omnitrophica bacterium]|nr:SGNH/GDSL hydrolase family protein [Candidatus Omnitrophota bacterium]